MYYNVSQAEENMTIIYSLLHTVKSSCTKRYFTSDFRIVHLAAHKEREKAFFSTIYPSSTLKALRLLKVCNFGIWDKTEKIFSLTSDTGRGYNIVSFATGKSRISSLYFASVYQFPLYLWRLALSLSLSSRNICGRDLFRETSSTGRNIASRLQTWIHASHNTRDITLDS